MIVVALVNTIRVTLIVAVLLKAIITPAITGAFKQLSRAAPNKNTAITIDLKSTGLSLGGSARSLCSLRVTLHVLFLNAEVQKLEFLHL